MELTKQMIEAGMSLNGGWSKAQTDAIGVPWPLEHGWKLKATGKQVSEEEYAKFLRLKDKHLTGRTLEKLGDGLLKGAKKGPPKWATERARKLVKSASGSNTFTCTSANCDYPRCSCGT